MNSALYLGTVQHRRHGGGQHAFQYKVFMPYIDLDELPHLFARNWSWSATGPALARFRREDFLGDPALPVVHLGVVSTVEAFDVEFCSGHLFVSQAQAGNFQYYDCTDPLAPVLAGVITGLLAQGLGPFEAAACGVHIAGAAADLFVERQATASMMAGDIIGLLPEALTRFSGS